MKRRSDHGLSEDISMKRIVRHKEHHDSPSPEPILDRDSRKRSLAEREIHRSYSSPVTTTSYDKYSSSKYNHSRRSSPMDRSPSIERHRRQSHGYLDSSPIKRSSGKVHLTDSSGSHHHHLALGGALYDSIEYSLHVSNLDMRPLEDELRKALFREFKRFGFISVKVVGYGKERRAFVNYQHYDQARRAKRENQSLMLFNRPIHVEWSKQTLHKYPEVATGKKPTSKSTPELRPPSSTTTSTYYHDSFSPPPRPSSTSKDHTHHHDHIVSSEHKRDVSYRPPPTRVEHSPVEAKPVVPITDPSATRTLFVGNLELDITERELRDLFSQYGRIESVDIKLAKSAGTTYAFVKFTTITDAMNAKEYLHGRQYGDFQLKIGFGKGSPTGKVWIGNLTCSRDLSEVRHEMDRFGLIRRCDYRDGDNHAYVHFENLDAAQAAVSSLSNFRLKSGRSVKLDLHKPSYFFRDSDECPVEYYSSSKRERRMSDEFLSSNHHMRESATTSTYYNKSSSSGNNEYFSSKGRDRVVSDSSRDGDRNYRKRSHNSDSYRQVTHSDDLNGDVGRSKRRAIEVEYSTSNNKSYYKSSSKDKPRHRREPDREHRANSNHSGEKREHGSGGDSNKHNSETEAKSNGEHKPNGDDKVHNFTAEANVSSSIVVEKDTALKLTLTDSTEPISPVGDSKSSKNDHSHTESLANLAKKYPVAWRGSLVLKNTGFPSRMYLIGGDPSVAEYLLKCKDETSALRITQRLRLEQPRLDEVNKRISLAGPSGHCVLFALPGPTLNQGGSGSPDESDSAMQLRPLRSLVSYLKQKEAAGIVALNAADIGENDKDPKEVLGVLHAFPPCEFSQSQLLKIIPSLGNEPSREDHIVVLLVKGNV